VASGGKGRLGDDRDDSASKQIGGRLVAAMNRPLHRIWKPVRTSPPYAVPEGIGLGHTPALDVPLSYSLSETLRSRWVTLRARRVTLRARWVTR
jgi:hypothetical protein